jgi:hypothetical protein
MDPKKIQAVVSRHLQAIRDDLKELEDSPENREKIQNAIRTALGDEGKAVGLGSILGECWAAFMPKLLFMARSPETELELLTAAQRLIKEQCMEFSRILSGQARQQPPNQNG